MNSVEPSSATLSLHAHATIESLNEPLIIIESLDKKQKQEYAGPATTHYRNWICSKAYTTGYSRTILLR